MSNLTALEQNGVLVVDSRLIAESLDIAHKNLLATLDKYQQSLETAFGIIAFETRKSERGKPERFAWLTEEQATFLMTLSRNTDRVVECKLALVKAFAEAKKVIKEVIPAQAQEMERLRLELELIRAKQRYQDSAQAILTTTSPSMLAYLRGDGPPPTQIIYRDRFLDPNTGLELGSAEGRSLSQLIADAGLNPKLTKDRNKVKRILHCHGFDYDSNQRWSTACYLREFKVLPDDVYSEALKAVLGELTATDSQPNLFVYQWQQAALSPAAPMSELGKPIEKLCLE